MVFRFCFCFCFVLGALDYGGVVVGWGVVWHTVDVMLILMFGWFVVV